MRLNNIKSDFKSALRVAKIELNSMFYSPVAWLVLFIFVCQIGYAFYTRFDSQLRYQDMGQTLWGVTNGIFMGMYGLVQPILGTLYLYIPLITMGLISREYNSGSIKLLYSSPIKNSSIILGKFISMMIYGLALLGILIFLLIFCTIFIKDFDYPVILTVILGYYLLIMAYSAIGIFMSSLTQYQVVAAIGTVALLAGLNYIDKIGQEINFVRDVTYWLSISGRSQDFMSGLIASEDLAYFIIVIAFFLILSIFKLDTEKTIMSRGRKIMGYTSIVAITFILGFITSRPQMKVYYDSTQDKRNTLALESQEVLKEVKDKLGDLKITTYGNILSDKYYCALPRQRIYDAERFEKYFRFMPGIEMDYVLYYDKTTNPSFTAERFQGESMEETVKKVCISDNIDEQTILTPEEFVNQYEDLSSEGNNFIRVIETKGGEKVYLRIFSDNESMPAEKEITAAIRRLVATPPMVGFVVGNGSREITNYGSRGYYLFGKDKKFRNSLLNNGFDTKSVNLDTDNIDDIAVLVISDLKEPLSSKSMANVTEYINRGGNLYILGDYNRNENMNKLTEQLGVKFSEGVLTMESEDYTPIIVFGEYTDYATSLGNTFSRLKRFGGGVSIPTGTALDYSKAQERGFTANPLLVTKEYCWLDYNTTDFVDGVFKYDEDLGEKKDNYVVALTLSRKVGEREQRIVISGDADIISNEELTTPRNNMQKENFSMITGVFRWLSYEKYPVDTTLPSLNDDKIYLPKGSRKYMQLLYVGLIPLIVLVTGIVIIVRRQKK